MKTYQANLKYFQGECNLSFGKYENGRLALSLVDPEDGLPIARVSVNIPDQPLCDDEIFVKDYSENEGMEEFLKSNGIASPTYRWVPSGHISCQAFKLLIPIE